MLHALVLCVYVCVCVHVTHALVVALIIIIHLGCYSVIGLPRSAGSCMEARQHSASTTVSTPTPCFLLNHVVMTKVEQHVIVSSDGKPTDTRPFDC